MTLPAQSFAPGVDYTLMAYGPQSAPGGALYDRWNRAVDGFVRKNDNARAR